MKVLDWATGGDGTAEEQHTAAEVGAEALYGDPNGLTQLVDELRGPNPNAKGRRGGGVNQLRRPGGE
jgi:hypothetical protein